MHWRLSAKPGGPANRMSSFGLVPHPVIEASAPRGSRSGLSARLPVYQQTPTAAPYLYLRPHRPSRRPCGICPVSCCYCLLWSLACAERRSLLLPCTLTLVQLPNSYNSPIPV